MYSNVRHSPTATSAFHTALTNDGPASSQHRNRNRILAILLPAMALLGLWLYFVEQSLLPSSQTLIQVHTYLRSSSNSLSLGGSSSDNNDSAIDAAAAMQRFGRHPVISDSELAAQRARRLTRPGRGTIELIRDSADGRSYELVAGAVPAYIASRRWPPKCCPTYDDSNCYGPLLEAGEATLVQERDTLVKQGQLGMRIQDDEAEEDMPRECGTGVIELPVHDQVNWMYYDLEGAYHAARQIDNDHRFCAGKRPLAELTTEQQQAGDDMDYVFFHVYWQGATVKPQAVEAIRSFLATQDLTQSRLIVWTPDEKTADWSALGEWANSKYISYRRWKLADQVAMSPLAPSAHKYTHELVTDSLHWVESDLFRLLVLHNYGGVYYDMDMLLLRDLAPILGQEWFYKWGSSCHGINGAIGRFFRHSWAVTKLMQTVDQIPLARDTTNWGRELYNDVKAKNESIFTVFPTAWFNPGWMGPDQKLSANSFPTQWNGPFAYHLHGPIWQNNFDQQSDYAKAVRIIAQRLEARKVKWLPAADTAAAVAAAVVAAATTSSDTKAQT